MEKFKKNSNKLNGLTIRQSDMSYELKNEITEVYMFLFRSFPRHSLSQIWMMKKSRNLLQTILTKSIRMDGFASLEENLWQISLINLNTLLDCLMKNLTF